MVKARNYIWFPLILLIWIGMHFYLPSHTIEKPSLYTPEYTPNGVNLEPVVLSNEDIIKDYATQLHFSLWRYAYWGVWLWMLSGFFEYLAQFHHKFWMTKKIAQGTFEAYAFIIIMAYTVLLW